MWDHRTVLYFISVHLQLPWAQTGHWHFWTFVFFSCYLVCRVQRYLSVNLSMILCTTDDGIIKFFEVLCSEMFFLTYTICPQSFPEWWTFPKLAEMILLYPLMIQTYNLISHQTFCVLFYFNLFIYFALHNITLFFVVSVVVYSFFLYIAIIKFKMNNQLQNVVVLFSIK